MLSLIHFKINRNVINNIELLYRAVPNHPTFWKPESNKLSSALFKQSTGVSIDRDAGRFEKNIVAFLNKDRKLYGAVNISAKRCREIGTKPISSPLPENKYHGDINNDNDEITIPRSKAKKLSESVKFVELPKSNKID